MNTVVNGQEVSFARGRPGRASWGLLLHRRCDLTSACHNKPVAHATEAAKPAPTARPALHAPTADVVDVAILSPRSASMRHGTAWSNTSPPSEGRSRYRSVLRRCRSSLACAALLPAPDSIGPPRLARPSPTAWRQ